MPKDIDYITCPFCKDGGFDLAGLKYHLKFHCDSYRDTEDVVETYSLKLKEAEDATD